MKSPRYHKQDYERFARALRSARDIWGVESYAAPLVGIEAVELRLIQMFSADNPAFDAERFRDAANGFRSWAEIAYADGVRMS